MQRVLSLLLFFGCRALTQVPERVEYVPDVEAWRVEVFAGAYRPGGVLQGPAREAGFREPVQMCFFPSGEGFVATEGVIMGFGKDRVLRYLAGSPALSGYRDGSPEEALLGRQLSICPDGRGGLYIGDRTNRCIRRLSRKAGRWVLDTVAGDPSRPASSEQLARVREEGALPALVRSEIIDGRGRQARFSYLHSNVIADAEGNAYVMDADYLRRISPEGEVTTLNPEGGTGAPAGGAEPLRSAHFRLIMAGGMCFGGDGNIYVADRWNHCVRKVDLAADMVTLAIGPGRGYIDGPAREAGFHDSPGHIVYDPYRKRFYTNGVDDWGLRTWQGGRMMTIAGGGRTNTATEGTAREAGTHWCGILAVDPTPPHDLYFWSNHANWKGRIGRLFQTGGAR